MGSLLGRGRELEQSWNLRSLQNYSLKTARIGTLGSFVMFSWPKNAQNPTFKTVLPFVFSSINISSQNRRFRQQTSCPALNLIGGSILLLEIRIRAVNKYNKFEAGQHNKFQRLQACANYTDRVSLFSSI